MTNVVEAVEGLFELSMKGGGTGVGLNCGAGVYEREVAKMSFNGVFFYVICFEFETFKLGEKSFTQIIKKRCVIQGAFSIPAIVQCSRACCTVS